MMARFEKYQESQPMLDSYLQFKRPSRNCLVCGVSLPELERHPSILKLSPKEEAVREDICPKCWEQMGHREYFCYWITHRYQQGPTPEARKLEKSERNEALWALFNALYARDESEDLGPQLFLLAHLLMKYRILAYLGMAEDGRLHFFHSPTQENFFVPDVPLDSVSFVNVKEQLDSKVQEFAPGPGEESSAGE